MERTGPPVSPVSVVAGIVWAVCHPLGSRYLGVRARITGDRLETRTSLEDRQVSTLVEAHGLFLGDGRRHELPDSVEDRLELGILLPLKVLQFLGQLMIGREDGPKADERPHDFDVHLYRLVAPKNAGEHGHAFLGEGIGRKPATTMPF